MGLFSKRQKRQSRRALRRAHTKALKAQAQAERKFANKAAKKAEKAARKTSKKGKSGARTAAASLSSAAATSTSALASAPSAALDKKAQRAASKDAKKAATEARKALERKQLSPAKVRRYLAVGRVVVPVLSPLLYRGATQLRGALDERRARALGVDVENLAEFTGHGARLSARINGLETSLHELDRGNVGAAGTEAAALASRDREFEQATTARLVELTTAVHAAERMPTARRRAAHSAIGTELDRIDSELLRRLGVR